MAVDWQGEQHTLNLGPLVNGTYQLEFLYTDLEGTYVEAQTNNITYDKSASTIQNRGSNVGIDWTVTKTGVKSLCYCHLVVPVFHEPTAIPPWTPPAPPSPSLLLFLFMHAFAATLYDCPVVAATQ